MIITIVVMNYNEVKIVVLCFVFTYCSWNLDTWQRNRGSERDIHRDCETKEREEKDKGDDNDEAKKKRFELEQRRWWNCRKK